MKALGPQDPQSIGEYRLVGRLGEGGMGQVYVARSSRGRTVALKLVLPELARQPEFRQRFRNEVDAARRIGGEWTAPVLDADLEAETPWVATGYVAGPSLHEVVAGGHGPLPERSVIALANGLARALHDIHGAHLIHRDLKPSNVLVTIDGPRVIDFGIARAAGDGSSALTRTGSVVGSPGFMSPEQCRGEQLTPASDVFCLGSVLAFAATGRSPFGDQDSAMHVLMLRIIQDEKDLSGLSDRLRGLISACLAPDPAARPALAELLKHTSDGDLWQYGRDGSPFGKQGVDPWLPAGLIAGLGRQAVGLLDSESPHAGPAPASGSFGAPSPYTPTSLAQPTPTGYAPTSVAPPTPTGYAPTSVAAPQGTAYAPTQFGGPPQAPPGPGPASGPTTGNPTGPYPPANARRSNQPWLIAAGAAALVLVLVVIFSMSGGGEEGGGTASDGETPAVLNDAYEEGEPEGSAYYFSQGDTVEFKSGMKLTISALEPFTPDETLAAEVESGYETYVATITVEDTLNQDHEVVVGFEAREDNGLEAHQLTSTTMDLPVNIIETIEAGGTLTVNHAYSLSPEAQTIDLEYHAGGRNDAAVWTLPVP
ncbi:protein kinase [Streptomyces sp. B6B3]|uniref:serine/threonine-protein kinase n=1 Tax=Streptomyces sp. B6B3 TaxID=3153570 RepID=UPI00325CC810